MALLPLPQRIGDAPDSALIAPHQVTSARWFSLIAGLRAPTIRTRGRAVVIGLDVGNAWLSGSRATLVHLPGARPLAATSRRLAIFGGTFAEPSLTLAAQPIKAIVRYRIFRSSADLTNAISVGVVLDIPARNARGREP